MTDVRIGLIGLDTSHVPAFAEMLNNSASPDHIPGAKVVAGFPGGSADFDLSINRVKGFTEQVRDSYGVKILDTPQAVAEASDVVFINAVDGRVHRQLFEQIAQYRRPTFIDKPLTTSLDDAKAILDLAEQNNIPVMSCSSLRYAEPLVAALADAEEGPIAGMDVFGPMDIRPPLDGLYWYGVHMVEMLVTALGSGCQSVQAIVNDQCDVIRCEWSGGVVGTMRGNRKCHHKYGVLLHREKNYQFIDPSAGKHPYYYGMLKEIMANLPAGRGGIPRKQMLEVMAIIDAANESRHTGEVVRVRQ